MAVISITRDPSHSGTINAQTIEIPVKYIAYTDDVTDDILAIYAHEDCPQIGDEYSEGSNIYCTGIESGTNLRCVQPVDGFKWELTANFQLLGPDEVTPGTSAIYPATPATYNGSGEFEPRTIDKDYSSTPLKIRNKAGDKYLNGVQKKFVVPQLEVTVNLSSPPDFSLQGKVNNATFTVGPCTGAAGTIMLAPIRFSGPYKDDLSTVYYTYTLVYLYASEGWNVREGKILEEGLNEILAGKKVRIVDEKGIETEEPYLLDDDAKAIRDGSDPVYTQYYIYQSADFSSIAF